MAIAFVLHEATRTGAPRLGAQIARELKRREDVYVLVMKDGPLTPWLKDTLGEAKVAVCPEGAFDPRTPFDTRVQMAARLIEATRADLVYVNSLASSVFALAASTGGRKTLLHVHEKAADMANLLLHDVTKLEVLRVADAVVLAAEDIRADLNEVFRFAPASMTNFGVAVDVEAARVGAKASVRAPVNARNAPLRRGKRMVVGMSGHASQRKGADVFLETAAALPAHDFLWVGGWRPDETIDNVAYETFLKSALPNLYVAGAVDNPYPYMAMMDLFFLSSREDPNPLVLGEALALGLPVLAFSATTAATDRLARWAIVCHGQANAKDAARVLGAVTAEKARSESFRAAGAAYLPEYDLKAKMPILTDIVARLRGEAPAPAPPPAGAARSELETGGLELRFT